MAVEQVLIATACDDASVAVARFGVHLAEKLGAELTVVAVLDEQALRELLAHHIITQDEAREYAEDIIDHGEKFLRRIAGMAAERGIACQTRMSRGIVHQQVLHAAAEAGADLIVMGEIEQLGIRSDRSLSEGQRILSGARCPRRCGEESPSGRTDLRRSLKALTETGLLWYSSPNKEGV